MQIYRHEDFDWNRGVGPFGNMAGIDPRLVAIECDNFGIPWWTSSWPYSGGISAYCTDDELWERIIELSK